jgi:hypothetical protein
MCSAWNFAREKFPALHQIVADGNCQWRSSCSRLTGGVEEYCLKVASGMRICRLFLKLPKRLTIRPRLSSPCWLSSSTHRKENRYFAWGVETFQPNLMAKSRSFVDDDPGLGGIKSILNDKRKHIIFHRILILRSSFSVGFELQENVSSKEYENKKCESSYVFLTINS